MTHPPELKKRAKELRKQGVYVKVIAADLGVPKATVIRWTNPELEKRERVKARKKKFSQGKKCPQCKKRRVSDNATLCQPCALASQRIWTREKLIEAVHIWAAENGDSPSWDDWRNSGPGHPAISSILDGPNPPFKSWGALIEAAGFTPRLRRRRRGSYPTSYQAKEQRAAMRRAAREERIKQAIGKGG